MVIRIIHHILKLYLTGEHRNEITDIVRTILTKEHTDTRELLEELTDSLKPYTSILDSRAMLVWLSAVKSPSKDYDLYHLEVIKPWIYELCHKLENTTDKNLTSNGRIDELTLPDGARRAVLLFKEGTGDATLIDHLT